MSADETDAGGRPIVIGCRVFVKDKNVRGVVKFVGTTDFAPGKWIGVQLPEAKGKNNGSVHGKAYFTCPDNQGLFVRQNQVQVLDSGQELSGSGGSRIPSVPAGNKRSPKVSPSLLRKPTPTTKEPERQQQHSPAIPESALSTETAKAEEGPLVASAGSEESLKVKDLEERLMILQRKRSEDKARIKELEKTKMQLQQLTEYKQKWTESQGELQQQLKAARKEAKEAVEAKEKVEEELRDLSDAVEMATLDKEMAEERCEGLGSECEALKEKVEELTIDLEILKNEISESGLEGAVAGYQTKQLEQQNQRLKEALVRLRDISQQDKTELQKASRDNDKMTSDITNLQQRNTSLKQELATAEETIDELKEQVDDALGAEEMVEKLTDKNLNLEERIEQLEETVTDLEALRDIAEEQEELRMELEHDTREEMDMQLNKTREADRKVEAAQEIVSDLQETIEKFRELVKNQQVAIKELQQKGESKQRHELDAQSHAVLSLTRQLKNTSVKAHSRAIETELRKLESQQSTEHISLLKSFMPNSFLTSGGDYDAILTLMLLPRLLFKAELIVTHLKLQYKLEEQLVVTSISDGERLTFITRLVYKLCYLVGLISRVQCVLEGCGVELYCYMGGHRDDLSLHERSLDALTSLLKEEMMDESVSLAGMEKAINYFEGLLDTQLSGQPISCTNFLSNSLRLFHCGTDAVIVQILQVKILISEGSQFTAQLKELESRCGDVAQICRKIKRKMPAINSKSGFEFGAEVVTSLQQCSQLVLILLDAMQKLQLLTSQKGNSLSDGELLSGGVAEELYREVSAQVIRSLPQPPPSDGFQDGVRSALSFAVSILSRLVTAIQDGEYDIRTPSDRPAAPCALRATAVKAELSDTEGLRYKLEERNHDILELKKSIKIKVQELSEAGVRIGLLEKRADNVGAEIQLEVKEKEERVQELEKSVKSQEEKFEKAMDILQGDIDSLEREKANLEKKLDIQSKKAIHAGIMGSRYTSSETVAAFMSGMGHGMGPSGGGGGSIVLKDSPQLVIKIDSLNQCLQFSKEENLALKAKIAKAQLASLPKLSFRRRAPSTAASSELVQLEKDVETTKQDCVKFAAVRCVVSLSQPDSGVSPSKQLEEQLLKKQELRLNKAKLLTKGRLFLASQLPGGTVNTGIASFTSPHFNKVYNEADRPQLIGRIKLKLASPAPQQQSVTPLLLNNEQLWILHRALVK